MIAFSGIALGILGGIIIIWITEGMKMPQRHYWVRTSHKYYDGIVGRRWFRKDVKGFTKMTYQCDRCPKIKRKTKPGYHE